MPQASLWSLFLFSYPLLAPLVLTQNVKLSEDKMLMGSDCDLKLALGYENSLWKDIRQTMLHQEEIFRNQVYELHRLYQTQNILMKELEMEVICSQNSHPLIGPSPKHLKCEFMASGMKFGEAHKMSLLRATKSHCLQEDCGTSRPPCGPLDLRISAHHYAHDDKNLFLRSYGFIAPGVPARMRYDIYDDKASSKGDLELSLRREGTQTCKDKVVCSHPHQAICQEELTCRDHVTQPAIAYVSYGTDRSKKNDSLGRVLGSPSLANGGQEFLETKHFTTGVEQCHASIGCKNKGVKRKLFASHEVPLLDLNSVPGESSDLDWASNSSKVSSSYSSHDNGSEYSKGTFLNVRDWKKSTNTVLNKPPMMDWDGTVKSTFTTSPGKSKSKEICGSLLTSMDVGSICGSPSEHKDIVTPKNEGCEVSFPDKTCPKISTPEIHDKKNKEVNLHSNTSSQEILEATESSKLPASCKSWITDDVSSDTKVEQCGIIDMSLVQQNIEPSVGMRGPSSSQEREDLAEINATVRKGAVSLMYFSTGCSARNHDHVPVSKSIKESCQIEKDVPQSSSESYEVLVLKQPECSPDEYCVSSTPFEVTSSGEKDCGVKVRRGRRMKDFRKEILPSLASLSRQEINEDVKSMELAMRSREYKKQNPKNNNKIRCSSSVRSRNSKFNRVGRRYYS